MGVSEKQRAIMELRREGSVFTRIALSASFDNFALIVIVLNAGWIGLEVDMNEGEDGINVFMIVENVFCTM